jgi:hypothetical protein
VADLDELEATMPNKPIDHLATRPPAELPTKRSYDPPPGSALPQKEAWEPQQRATRRPEFADRVARTSEPSLYRDAPAPLKPPPRRTGAITWESEAAPETEPEDAEEEGLSDRQFWLLASLAVLVFVLGVAWAVKALFGQQTGEVPAAVAPVAPAVDELGTPGGLSEADYNTAGELAKKFLASPTLDAVMPLIRDPERVRPLMDEFYNASPWRSTTVRSLAPREVFQTKDQMLAGMVELDDFSRRPIAFLRTPDGIKVDWESYVAHGEVPWERLAEVRPTLSVLMRVRLTPDDYYNLDFTDARTYACYRLTSHDTTHRVYGYARRDSVVYARLLERVRPNAFTMPTVRIRFKEAGLSDDQVEITEVVSDGWLVTADAPASAPAGSPRPTSR